jgi:hypothetical protein
MNKVLNRPLFRKAALKKGYLKPLHAQTGVMVGQPINNPNPQINPRTPVPALRPNIARRAIGDLRSFIQRPGQFFNPKVTRFVPGAGTAGLIGMEGLAPIIGAGRRKLGLSDESALAPIIDYGLAGLISATPIGRVAGLTTLAGRAALGAKDYIQQKPIGTTMSALSPDLGKPLGLFDRPEPGATGRRKAKRGETKGITLAEIAKADEQGFKKSPRRKQVEKSLASLRNQGDELAQEKYAGAGEADLNKIQDDTISPTLPGEPRDQAKVAVAEQPKQPEVKQPKTKIQQAADQEINKSTANLIQTGGASDDTIFNQNIKLARQYFDELNKGQSSQAKLVFLSNLASGLLTGTTTRSGIGGALEVFGQALGPAVNNLVTVKLKEGELRARRREASLEAALEHMSFLNKAAQRSGPEKYGVIQVRGVDGKIRNYNGVLLEDGTAATFGGLDPNTGREIFDPIGRGPVVIGGQVVGNFENFKEQSTLDKRLYDIQDTLGNKYSALAVARDILKTLNQEDAEGRTPKAGAALKGDLILKRFTGVIRELTGGRVLQDDFANLETGQIEGLVDRLFNDEAKKIREDDTLTAPEKSKLIQSINKNKLLTQARGKVRKFSGLTGAEQERLAVQEVTLIYALANTFKDQDRLTQRDINAAREIVNIISFRRSSKDVKDSISAIASQIEADIRRQELLFREGGGLESTIKALRDLGLYVPFETAKEIQGLAEDLSKEEIEEGLGDIQL